MPGKGHMVLTGKKRTVAFLRPGGRGGIFQRQGAELVPIYWFVPSVRIKPELQFVKTIERTVQQRFDSNFVTAFDAAIKSAKAPSQSSWVRLGGSLFVPA